MVQSILPPKEDEAIVQFPLHLQKLIHALQATPPNTPAQAEELVLRASIKTDDLLPWADFEHPVADSYGRKLVFKGDCFEVMVMSWLPGDFSAIHDHGAAEWGAVQCFGDADHFTFAIQDGLLVTTDRVPYYPGMVRAVDHQLIHQMGNSSSQPCLSLHVYGCYGPLTNITGGARIFDLLENSIQYTNGGGFFCLPEDQINQRHPGFYADEETTCRHHRQMADRLAQILAQPRCDRRDHLVAKRDYLQAQIELMTAVSDR